MSQGEPLSEVTGDKQWYEIMRQERYLSKKLVRLSYKKGLGGKHSKKYD